MFAIFRRVKAAHKTDKQLEALDDRVIEAVFKPAIEHEYFGTDFSRFGYSSYWLEDNGRADTRSFIQAILELSEYYAQSNPVLSAGLWGTYNSADYLTRNRLMSKDRENSLFMHLKGLVATTVLHFADGTPSTEITSDARSRMDWYEAYAEKAIKTLKDNPLKKPRW